MCCMDTKGQGKRLAANQQCQGNTHARIPASEGKGSSCRSPRAACGQPGLLGGFWHQVLKSKQAPNTLVAKQPKKLAHASGSGRTDKVSNVKQSKQVKSC